MPETRDPAESKSLDPPEKLLEIFEKQLGSNDLVSLFQGVLNDIELERMFKAALKNDDQERCSEIL
ncbi:uncharacterized protein PHALS_06760 [Plasmopara halstedii]|uniref:Uncharacterized protein n=1 Tax=Plasmopara halstedii TaxID=4781 RepID=A0A0P1B5L6_PLAHL|nr:uncharacterized protein PHALS_06760 [Plasmopara halstedii]CEG48970.1 hypothetical protein PHALS_06760 [Plasmopara halstedii]|eukprot:XP_024585339.1 hypothetical protein PHALS_06760 [Plasmopara halstedii]